MPNVNYVASILFNMAFIDALKNYAKGLGAVYPLTQPLVLANQLKNDFNQKQNTQQLLGKSLLTGAQTGVQAGLPQKTLTNQSVYQAPQVSQAPQTDFSNVPGNTGKGMFDTLQSAPSLSQAPETMPVPGQPQQFQQQPQQPQQSQAPSDLFTQTLTAMLEAAKGTGNEDLQAKRNAIIQARFNAQRAPTAEELRVLSPSAQASLRGLDVQGLETQLGGVETALKGREAKTKAQQEARQNVLQLLLKKQELDKPERQTGIVGEYQFYADQEKTAGRTPVSFDEYQTQDANRKIRIEKSKVGGLDPALANIGIQYGTRFDNSPIVKQFNEIQNKKLVVDNLLKQGSTGPGDVALVYDFMKSLDPTSVVRESEYALGASSGNIFAGAFARFNGYFKAEGGKLPENVRKEFQNIITQRYGSVKTQYDNLYSENKRKMQEVGISDPDVFLTNYAGALEKVNNELGDPLDEALNKLGFKNVDSDTKKAVSKIISIPDGTAGGQCGSFIYRNTGFRVGDSFESKMAKMDPKIKVPKPGMVFTMPYRNTGHFGIILSIKNGVATVKDSNYQLDEKVRTHDLPISLMTGFNYV